MRAALAFVMLGATAVEAHHSIAGMYDSSRPVTIDGIVTEYRFVNPHPYLDMRDSRTSQIWRLEMDNRRELESIGVGEHTIKPGDRLVVTGSPSRRGASQMYIERLQRPSDGFGFEQYRSSPRRLGGRR
jgi:hypothetical protein